MENTLFSKLFSTNDNSAAQDALATIKLRSGVQSTFNLTDSKSAKPSDKARKEEHVAQMIADGEELSKQHESYYAEFVVRGNKALYELLSSIYAYALRINESPLKEQIIERMRKELKERGVKTTSQTHWLTTVVKFIVGADRATASNYSRVLQVAFEEDLAADGMADYIERRGGMTNIRDTEANAGLAELAGKTLDERLELFRRLFRAFDYQSECSITIEDKPTFFLGKGTGDATSAKKTECGTFVHLLAIQGESGQYYVLNSGYYSKALEDSIMRTIANTIDADNETVKAHVAFHEHQQREWLDAKGAASKAIQNAQPDAVPA